MLAFVDESGDPGMKVQAGSSPLFLVALVIFNDDAAAACDERISLLRDELSLSPRFEFHFAHNSDRVKEAFLAAVTQFDFTYHVYALDKLHAWGTEEFVEEGLYRWTARTTFEYARPYLDEATVVIDKSGERRFRDELAGYLRRRINDGGRGRHIAKVKLQASHQNNLLQLADYVAGISARSLTGARMGEYLRSRYLGSHEASCRVWP